MKRRTVHGLFFVACTGLAAMAGWHVWGAWQAAQLDTAVQAAPSCVKAGGLTGADTLPGAVVLACGNALAAAGTWEAAARTYGLLGQRAAQDASGRDALFNLGNLYLRQGMAVLDTEPAKALPLIELAKQRYRGLLRLDPQDWDARYNLERALRLAPEDELSPPQTDNEVAERREMKLRDMNARDLP